MSKKIGTEISFQEKFKDRMENMGKDGMIGIMKNIENPINKIEMDKMEHWNNLYNESNKIRINSSRLSNDSRNSNSKIGNSGQMVIANKNNFSNNSNNLSNVSNFNSHNMNNQMQIGINPINANNQMFNNNLPGMMNMNSGMMNMNPGMLNMNPGVMNANPCMNNMNPYYNPNYNPNQYMNNQMMMGHNYMNQPYNQQLQPLMYNPYQINNTPLNNYNYNTNINNTNTNNVHSSGNKNQPVKIISSRQEYQNTQENINDNSKIQRSMSSRYKLSKNKNNSENSINLNNSKFNQNQNSNLINTIENGPSTNPDSFIKCVRNSSYKNNKLNNNNNSDDGTYIPYTLKDYKEISTARIVMGSLGPNTGTKEWDERQRKLKKMEEYAIDLKQMHKVVLKVKKETPQEIIEKHKKEKIENSNRFKSYEYSKLVKPKSTYAYEHNHVNHYSGSENINNINKYNPEKSNNEVEENKSKFMKDYHNRNKYSQPSERNENKNIRYNNDFDNNKLPGIDSNKNTNDDLGKLQKQREAYNLRINEIKESLLK